MDHTLTNAGLKPDEEKEFPALHDLHNLRRFIGMIKYLSKFEHSVTTKCERRRGTSKSIWRHKESYRKYTCLSLQRLRKAVTIQTDMFDVGVGAVLLQNGKQCHTHHGFGMTMKKNYAQIEKEMRAAVFGLHKFSDYCHGRHVIIESDHKPFEAISNKPLSKAPKRLLRMMLSIQNFD